MTTFDNVEALIHSNVTKNPCIRQCSESLHTGTLARTSTVGTMTARELFATFTIRAGTSAAAGAWTCGFPESLLRVEQLQPDTSVLLFHFQSDTIHFIALFTEPNELLGCIGVRKRENDSTSFDPTGRRQQSRET